MMPTKAAMIHVTSSTTLNTALSNVNPGDSILLSDGNYAGFTISRKGSSAKKITIMAVNPRKAVVNSGFVRFSSTSNIVVIGLTLTTPGSLLPITVNGATNYYAGVWFDQSDSCRLTQCTLQLTNQARYTQWVYLSGNSNWNRIDHCEFGPNTIQGHFIWPHGNQTIAGITPPADRSGWANGSGPYNPNMARNTQIDSNYFHDQAPGTGEIIVVGGMGTTGDYQDLNTVIENNLLVNCDGDAEIIAIKGSSNTIRYNTVVTSSGMISSRSGNKNTIHGNFMLQGKKPGAGGIKLYEMDHSIYNNYIENCAEYPILVGGGDPYYETTTFDHAQVVRAKILNNTIVNCDRQVRIGHGSPLPPVDLIFSNNIISNTSFSESLVPTGDSYYSGNFIYPYDFTKAGFNKSNPNLTLQGELMKLSSTSPAINNADQNFRTIITEDIDGELRSSLLDAGADEYSNATTFPRKILTASQVGPGSILEPSAPALPGNLSAAVVSSNQVRLNWADHSNNEDFFVIEYSLNGTSWSEVKKVYASNATATISNLNSLTNYYFRVYAINGFGRSDFSNVVNVTVGGAIPSNWTSADIGIPTMAGGATYVNNSFSINGSGADIWGKTDQFQFVYQAINADFGITAKVLSVDNTNNYSKAGLMIRQSLNADAPNVCINVGPLRTSLQNRPTAGASTIANNGSKVTPVWLRLLRFGNVISGYESSDGVNWTQLGPSINLILTGTAYAGLAVTSHNTAALCNAQFESVTYTTTPTALKLTTQEELGLDYFINSNEKNVYFSYHIPKKSKVNILAYSIEGKIIPILNDQLLDEGAHQSVWNYAGFEPGIYFIRLISDGYIKTVKVGLF
ncbi:MAG TPA: chondroitinase-B domain-containing protein [Bacteroidales bacterium]|nr:chondroitinase-B domain-containing protein [Bacteroidales bacterium]